MLPAARTRVRSGSGRDRVRPPARSEGSGFLLAAIPGDYFQLVESDVDFKSGQARFLSGNHHLAMSVSRLSPASGS